MALITKNGQIHIPTKTGKQKGFVTKNGQISILIPYAPADEVVTPTTTTTNISTVMGVALSSVSTVMGVASSNISTIMGVSNE